MGLSSQARSREASAPRHSTSSLYQHTDRIFQDRTSISHSPQPAHSQTVFDWSVADASSRTRMDGQPRDAADYLPPRNWFDHPSLTRGRPASNSSRSYTGPPLSFSVGLDESEDSSDEDERQAMLRRYRSLLNQNQPSTSSTSRRRSGTGLLFPSNFPTY